MQNQKHLLRIGLPPQPKKAELHEKQEIWNKKFRRKRVVVEHVIRKCKIFRIAKEKYRSKRKKIDIVWAVVCGLVNFKT